MSLTWPSELDWGQSLFIPNVMALIYRSILRDCELPLIMRIIEPDLSEPYSIYTYRHFTFDYPDLCILCFDTDLLEEELQSDYLRDVRGELGVGKSKEDSEYEEERRREGRLVGVIIGRVDLHKRGLRAYIGMLAVAPSHRRLHIARDLSQRFIEISRRKYGVVEVVLEAEVKNAGALRLYEGLGFVRDKWLGRYYASGEDAYRLKLFLPISRTGEDNAVAQSANIKSI